jgi:thiol-disulfide isomerase/thioredoxin
MKIKYMLVLLLMNIAIGNLRAQTNSVTAVNIGDKVPEIEFTLLNAIKPTVKLSDFKGKVVLLYFWSTSCTSCIKKFPKLDSLQALFGEKIKIILVDPKRSGDTEPKINRILSIYKKNYRKTLELSAAFNDTIGVQYFPHVINSHFAWIDPQGVFKAATGYATRHDIELMLAGKNPGSLTKDDFVVSRKNEALFTLDVSNIKFKSMLTGYLDGLDDFKKQKVKSFFGSDPKNGIRFINMSVLQILGMVHGYFPDPNLVVVEADNRADFVCPESIDYDAWSKDNTYCYELIAPNMTKEACKQQMISDIKKAFHIETAVEKRKVLCWVIKMDEQQMKKTQRKNKSLQNLLSLTSVASQFQFLDIPVIADTKFDTALFSSQYGQYIFEMLNEADLQEFVKNNGLTLVKEEREQKVFVIRKVDK